MDVNLKPSVGNWKGGYALDKHIISSEFIGNNSSGYPMFDTTRTEAGEAVYQLKYRRDADQAALLADTVIKHILPKFPPIGLIIPMPPSTQRQVQPVVLVAKAISEKIGIYGSSKILVSSGGPSLKNIGGKAAKIAALDGRFSISDQLNEGRWDTLLIDDLFDSGASMEVACAKLMSFRKVNNVYVAALTWK